MSKKLVVTILLVVGILSIIFILALLFFSRRNQRKEEIINPSISETSPTSFPAEKVKLKTYKDEAGFSFNYSSTLLVKEMVNQDENTYSWLEISDLDRPGEKISIKVTDTNLTSLEDWLKKNRQDDWVVNETVVGGMNGKLIHGSQKITSVAIAKGIIFLIESPADSAGFWEEQQKIIRESFKVQWPEEKSSDSGGEIILEEEVIE